MTGAIKAKTSVAGVAASQLEEVNATLKQRAHLRALEDDPSEIARLESNASRRRTVLQVVQTFFGTHNQAWPLLKRLNWLHVPLLTLTPIVALYGLFTTPFYWQTMVWSVVYYFLTGLGITMGYHRLFAHRAYKAVVPMRFLLALLGAGAVEGSIRWWSRDHRAHHTYVDTDKDPYAVTHGFWHAHIGWMLVKQEKERIGRADISDLSADPIVAWQHKFYLPIAVFMGFILPTLVAGLGWGDYRGGYFLAGVARLVFVHHSTFCVNSLAHYWGEESYSDGHTAKNSIITALCTVGEGYHNFHHEFPSDYRNGVRWYQYDPTKWVIRFCSFFGLTYDLQRFPDNEIAKGKIQMKQKKLDEAKLGLNWGKTVDELPVYSMDWVAQQCKNGKALVVLDGCVLDITAFKDEHPGGKIINSYIGQDITTLFRGGAYMHSNAAQYLQRTMRIGKLAGTNLAH